MAKIHKTHLEAKVEARNRANKLAMLYQGMAMPIMDGFKGKKVVCKTGGTAEAVKKALPPLIEEGTAVHSWFSASRYSLAVVVKVCELNEERDYSGANYAEGYAYLCEVDSKTGNMVKLSAPVVARTDYTVDEVLQARAKMKEAQNALDEARSALAGFGEYDN